VGKCTSHTGQIQDELTFGIFTFPLSLAHLLTHSFLSFFLSFLNVCPQVTYHPTTDARSLDRLPFKEIRERRGGKADSHKGSSVSSRSGGSGNSSSSSSSCQKMSGSTSNMFEVGSMGVLSGLGPEQVMQTEMGATQLAFFEAPLKETGMLFNREVCYYPMQNLQDGGPWTFLVPGEKVSESDIIIIHRYHYCHHFPPSRVCSSTQVHSVSVGNIV
jgi:hypothetical protein